MTLHCKNSILDSHYPQDPVFSLILWLGLCPGQSLSSYYEIDLAVIGSKNRKSSRFILLGGLLQDKLPDFLQGRRTDQC